MEHNIKHFTSKKVGKQNSDCYFINKRGYYTIPFVDSTRHGFWETIYMLRMQACND